MVFSKKVVFEFLHIFVLAGFAVAQPVYDLLGKHPEFFVAHKAGPFHIVGMVLLLSFGLPLCICLAEMLAGVFGRRFRQYFHTLMVGILAGLVILPAAGRLVSGNDIILLVVSAICGIAFALLYLKLPPARTFMSVLIPVILIFPLWFLGMTPVSRLVLPESVEAVWGSKVKHPVPVILVVLDEFNTTALLDETGKIDSVRFPNFAALANQSHWFPNAVAAHYQTMQAIPAILTGRHPPTDTALTATAADYPENLFTFLGNHYQVRAYEAQTALCPENICLKEPDDEISMDLATFFSDIRIIYLHIVSPSGWAQRLPKLGGQWTGFAQNDISDNAPQKTVKTRREQFERFISGIDRNRNRQLCFLHILFPHLPYRYLSTGHRYNRSINQAFPEGINDEFSGWTLHEPLIHVAYLQYLQQIGYVDHFLGNLLEKLAENNLLEKSLVIVTADHGVSFQAGYQRRNISDETAGDVLKVPMFVKLPGQQQGKINENLVSGIDIFPTIADILGMEIPWEVDGCSMFSGKANSRKWIDFAGILRYQAEDLDGFSNLDWQVRHFGSGTPLEQLGLYGPFPGLVGQKLSGFHIQFEKNLKFNSDVYTYFDHTDPDSGFLPALFYGDITGTDQKASLPLAIALNGQIWATTMTSPWLGMERYFATLFPPGAFRKGHNRVDVFLVNQSDTGITLSRISSIHQEMKDFSIRYEPDGTEILVLGDGDEMPIDREHQLVHGYVDSLECRNNALHILGWAGDSHHRPAESILIFENEQLMVKTKPHLAREDVAGFFGQESMLLTGFQASVPHDSNCEDISEIRIFAVSHDGDACELGLSGESQ